jgi:hypothetical protein
MNACQADLFWSDCANKRTYLFGDRYQQIYRFRGASSAFHDAVKKSSVKLTLTGSFRFGSNIAQYASCVLVAFGGDHLYGRAVDNGTVEVLDTNTGGNSTMKTGVVLCRTKNGEFKYLNTFSPPRWCYLGGQTKFDPKIESWQHELYSFLKGDAVSFVYKGEIFESREGIKEYIDDEEDIDLSKAFTLLEFLVSQNKSLDTFYDELRRSFSPMKKDETPDTYNGVIMSTVHKAKGLEFSCPVLIWDDFNFKAISSAVVNKKIHCDEANHLYVAISRAKKRLILAPSAKSCLDDLANKGFIELPPTFILESCRVMLVAWEADWKLFSSDSGSDVPYPPEWNATDYPLAIHPLMSVSEQRRCLHSYLRRLHPDKFFPRFGNRFEPNEKKALTENLLQITRRCNEMLESLRGEDGEEED